MRLRDVMSDEYWAHLIVVIFHQWQSTEIEMFRLFKVRTMQNGFSLLILKTPKQDWNMRFKLALMLRD